MIKTVVFPVAGLGTRFLPATKAIPKEMLPVLDKPLIQYAVEEALDSGIERFIFITSYGKSAIEDHFDYHELLENTLKRRHKNKELDLIQKTRLSPGQAVFIRQQEPLGLGHAILCAKKVIKDEPFAVILPDDLILSKKPCMSQMVNVYQKGNMVAVMDVPFEDVHKYGILKIEKEQGPFVQASGVIEKPSKEKAPSQTAIVGRYILSSDIFSILENQERGAGGEIQLTDAFIPMIDSHGLYGYRFSGQRFDCGNKQGWLEANIAYACYDKTIDFEKMVRKYIKD
ncbi:MAG: UTP--glucose-1-phosphate uridylyltransferase GalU [Proteobacteria bacterium]|nr:UTP--glucose-1-phosphate uridylyltransferase GalU [Pseudomonadota bacterium]